MVLTRDPNTKEDALRRKTVEAAKRHRASWIELGQYLFHIYRDKNYRNWGYLAFDTYCIKELHIKPSTASKLLRSYAFLEREEPRLAALRVGEEGSPEAIPSYESVNLLRLVKENKKLTDQDYTDLREAVIEAGKEPKEVRAQVKKIIAERDEERNPKEVRAQRRNSTLKRLITILSSAKSELSEGNWVPAYVLKQMGELIRKLQDQLE
ncbi:MAG: hypothetical protein NC930_04710 [Candidatus Omnitrophica bacterium]|nr:hypothetical protein [Candidatus Omnitrophota bacterium]